MRIINLFGAADGGVLDEVVPTPYKYTTTELEATVLEGIIKRHRVFWSAESDQQSYVSINTIDFDGTVVLGDDTLWIGQTEYGDFEIPANKEMRVALHRIVSEIQRQVSEGAIITTNNIDWLDFKMETPYSYSTPSSTFNCKLYFRNENIIQIARDIL